MTMSNWNREQHEAVSHTRGHYLALSVFLVICHMFTVSMAAGDVPSVSQYPLTSQEKVTIGEDGSLELLSETPHGVLLKGHLDSLADSRRRRSKPSPLETFFFQAQEGQTGGQRGFSSQADDDGDGLVDEDQLDGKDNDGDGRIDEDFAAVSDAMTAVHLSEGDGVAQLEWMHWAGSRLQNALFLNFSATHEMSGVTVPYYHLESTVGPWQEIDVFSVRHNLAGESQKGSATAFVVRVEAAESMINLANPSALDYSGPLPGTWLGVLILDQSPKAHARGQFRPLLDGRLLSLPLTEEPLGAVICTAPSWLQLNRLLLDAVAVREGVADPISNQRVPWIVSPLCSRCRFDNSVDFQVLENPNGELALKLRLETGQSGLMDPDLFVLEGVGLGSPAEIIWEPAEARQMATSWKTITSETLGQNSDFPQGLYGLLESIPGHEASGNLIFAFSNPAGKVSPLFESENELNLKGTWLDGRAFSTQCPVVRLARDDAAGVNWLESDPAHAPEPDFSHPRDGRLSLAPSLLEGWPNPFRDQIRIDFVVPSTIKETFDWEGDKPLPPGVDLAAPMAWQGGQPSVSVKVYSINGQELVSLQQGTLSEGRYTVNWNGTDAAGRQVASGTYFCKLQMDEWSVTRRLVFIR
jgi:FlgD Ig-like domain